MVSIKHTSTFISVLSPSSAYQRSGANTRTVSHPPYASFSSIPNQPENFPFLNPLKPLPPTFYCYPNSIHFGPPPHWFPKNFGLTHTSITKNVICPRSSSSPASSFLSYSTSFKINLLPLAYPLVPSMTDSPSSDSSSFQPRHSPLFCTD